MKRRKKIRKIKKISVLVILSVSLLIGGSTVFGASWISNQVYGNTRTRGAYGSGAIYNETYAKVGNAYDYKYNTYIAAYSQAMGNKGSSHTAWVNLIWGP